MELRLMLISAIITIVMTAPIMMRYTNRGAFRKKSEIIIAEATAAGRVAQAILVSKSLRWGDEGNPDKLQRQARWLGTYTYTVNGKEYLHTTSSPDDLPETLSVYYPDGHPEKAISAFTYKIGAKPVFLALFPLLVWFIVYQILIRLF